MNNNGYTKIPNAIIRLATISPSERSAWCLIASLPHGYALSVNAACDMLGINHKTWRQCVAVLKKRNMISVESVPGHANVYCVTPAENWDITPSKNREYQKTAVLPKINTPPMPKNGRGNNKEQLKTYSTTTTTCACAREKLVEELLTDARIELAMMQHHITVEQYRKFVSEIIADWQFRDLPDADYNLNHFSSVLRYKVANINRNNGNNGNNTQSSSADSIRAKLDADAVKAMAALAAESRQPKIVPF